MPNSQPLLEITAIIELNFSNQSEQEAIMKALIPDNINFPKGLSMDMSSKDNTALCIKFSSRTQIETLINTVDEVLQDVSLAKKVINGA
ncbi:MAG TPA: KEOPS complex subunit Pcc1 [Nitrososphaeraceae archaeon]|nr:KEOPS complex subunit Pcc1 [Nitrososphaeraceae archaeon]